MKKQGKKFKTVEALAAYEMPKPEFVKTLIQEGQSAEAVSAKVEAAIAAGAPVNGDGSINVAKFVGWLIEHTK